MGTPLHLLTVEDSDDDVVSLARDLRRGGGPPGRQTVSGGSIKESEERLRVLSRHLLTVQEAERRHLARDLHDEIVQALTAIKLNLQVLQGSPDASSSGPFLADSLRTLDRLLQGVRSVSLKLCPSQLDDLGLPAALRWLVEQQAQRAGWRTQVADRDGMEALESVKQKPRIMERCMKSSDEIHRKV